MSQWLEAWRGARRSGVSDDPVFLALNDTQKTFAIPDALLEDLVRGTTMDLEPRSPVRRASSRLSPPSTTSIAIAISLPRSSDWSASGSSATRDPRAEKLAEETGVAFQLTNILRDVKEDVERGRVYLPLDLLNENGISTERLKALTTGAAMNTQERTMLRSLGSRAEQYYGSAQQLLPLIDRDSRAALWVLVRIYHKLLRKIANADNDVFSQRISVPTPEKLLILTQGAAMALSNRVTA